MTLHRFAVAASIALFAASEILACSAKSWDSNEIVENAPVYSANGRFCVVVRWYAGVADFKSARARDIADAAVADANSLTAAFYEGRRLVAEIPVDNDMIRGVLVADSGRYFVVVRGLGGPCSGSWSERDPFLTIYKAEGPRVGTLRAVDALSPNDISRLSSDGIHWELRHETVDREVVVLAFPTSPKKQEVRVDLATAVMLDPKREIFPSPHAYATAAAGPVQSYETPSSPDCVAAYGAANLVRVDSSRFVAQALHAPAPEFPRMALLARVRANVVVDVIVSESGDVICTRSTAKPFGLSAAAVEAAKRWKFRPFGGRVAGEILFHFEDVDEETWRDLMRRSPYH
jgi:hypothetical protein